MPYALFSFCKQDFKNSLVDLLFLKWCPCISTRVVQKLIGTLTMRQQISLVMLALEPGFLDLIKDVHGNHVVQRCLQCLSKEHTKV